MHVDDAAVAVAEARGMVIQPFTEITSTNR